MLALTFLDNHFTAMSYYFTIIGTKDNPLFEHEFGTSKPGGDGTAKFREEAAHMNQFIVHAALDMVEEAQWGTKDLYVIIRPRRKTPLCSNQSHFHSHHADS